LKKQDHLPRRSPGSRLRKEVRKELWWKTKAGSSE